MAFTHGIDAVFELNSTDISTYLSELDVNFERALAELAHLGDSWQQSLKGIRVGTISASGDFDPTLDALLWSAFDGDTAVTFAFYPQGKSSGLPEYTGSVMVSGFKPGPASAGGSLKQSMSMTCSGTVTRGTYTP